MQILKIKTKPFIATLGVFVIIVSIFTGSVVVLSKRGETKPSIAGTSTVSAPETTPSSEPSPSPKPSLSPTPKSITKKIVTTTSPTPSPIPNLSQTIQPLTNINTSPANTEACKKEAEGKKNEWINQEKVNLMTAHPELYSYEAAVAMDPAQFSSQYEPQGAYEHWVIYSNNLRSVYESDIQSTSWQIENAYYAQCISK